MPPNASIFTSHYVVNGGSLFAAEVRDNVSEKVVAYFSSIGGIEESSGENAKRVWVHCLAIAYSPMYLDENSHGVTTDWPRIPLPDKRERLDNSAALGAQVAALLDTEADVPGVTSGAVSAHLRMLGAISGTNLNVKAGWGSRDFKGAHQPGPRKTETRDWTNAEKEALRNGFAAKDIEEARGFALLGRAVDVYLNETNFWRGVPEAVWNYVIGGYLVIKKWLSYREEAILGRPLTSAEAREVTAMVRRLSALILLSDQLDVNYAACRDNVYVWPNS